ncbi:sugar ABC transporter ATP-binding protein [Thermosipho ferrireducens]|uniref:Sugar ABC transporter ATP-binding protein n=1 Tax=Thermosipho ferrireducens TaxID=2571116 RepID=A0ABX7S4Q7_9BACT|nr:sugar ABC transporter ATP-binding protein [Thermosipho ferrireducens]QTA37447.1 sugar ABC transporter ATP-binding protein [Thermosipho ferrireducens]
MQILKMKKIIKQFPGVLALDKVDFDLNKGEVHALLGENGAGKSTLIKIISGVHKPDSGRMIYFDKELFFSSPTEAINAGIATIHQEVNLFEDLTVAESIFVGNVKSFIFSKKKMFSLTKKLLDALDFPLKAAAKIRELNTSEKQLVSIAKALSLKAKVIIMDEPTATITDHETKRLFEIIRNLKQRGISVIFISHRLEEIFEIADRVTVLRDGKLIGAGKISDFTRENLIKMMVGREIDEMYPKFNKVSDKVIFEVKKLSVENFVKDISFTLKKGEIFGLAGLVGAGKSEIALGLYGYLPSKWESLKLHGKEIKKINSPVNALKNGIALVPEDRKKMGLILELDVVKNISIQNAEQISSFGVLSWKKAKKIALEEIKKYAIKVSSQKQKVKTLSGGNQQKVILSKVLRKKPKVLFLVEPTRGIDVGAKVEVYNIINKLANNGVGIVFISSELPEIVSLCDRVMVMHRGRSMGILEKEDINQENILKLATGVDVK